MTFLVWATSESINCQLFTFFVLQEVILSLYLSSGVQSAMQHDTIMSSDNPDFVLVESEAKKVAESAVKALKMSRRQCQQAGGGARRWGQPTWTGQHGSVGAPRPQRSKFNVISQQWLGGNYHGIMPTV